MKLELNILSKLVDLVHGTSTNRSMTVEAIDANAIPGLAQAEVRRELSRSEHVGDRPGTDDKGAMEHIEDGHATKPRYSSSVSGSPDENHGITRVFSHHPGYTARIASRESDVLYADVVRSLK